MKEIEEIHPEMLFINRSSVGAWEAPGYAEAVRKTGRKQLIDREGALAGDCFLIAWQK